MVSSTSFVADLPAGPLTSFRQQASFDWKALKVLLEGEESIKFKNHIYATLSSNPLFRRDFHRPSLDEHRRITHQQWKAILQYKFVDDVFSDLDRTQDLYEVLETYEQGLAARFGLHASVFATAILSMGTARHQHIVEQARNHEIFGCFCLTEISHGSNTAEIGTTATFDKGEFVFDTPHDGAIKCWAGNLGQSATHAVVFAQLYVAGKCEGMHAFILQVRDLKTHRSLPGITIGDMGTKPGAWNAVENGWMEFEKHRAPLWALLNKGSDVTSDGRYVSAYKSQRERQSVSLGALSAGRVGIIGKGALACSLASVIAIRYSAVRKQFGPKSGTENEVAVLSYPLQRHRLFPILAQAFVIRIFQRKLMNHFTEYMMRMMGGEKSEELAELSKEVHGLSSCAKPVSTWMGVASLAEARTCCGGHGFLQLSRLNNLRDDFDPSQTFEGENNMLLQQTSSWLLAKKASQSVTSPMGSTNFLANPTNGGTSTVEKVLSAYSWLITHLIAKTELEQKRHKSQGKDAFAVRNETQVYTAHTLSVAFAERTMLAWAQQYADDVEDRSFRSVLQRLCNIFALERLERHLATLYIGGFCTGPSFGEWIRTTLVAEEEALAPDAVALVDVIAPPDLALNSALGASDGRAYEHLVAELRRHTDSRPDWIPDLTAFLASNRQAQSKL